MENIEKATIETKINTNKPNMITNTSNHLLDLDDLSTGDIETIFSSTNAMKEILNRDIKKVPALRGKSIVTLFYEPSTRTRASFEQAGKILSADVINITNKSSSVEKGESLYNTVKTIEAMGVDIIIIRHPHSGAPYLIARNVKASVINAGDGSHAHPTQALLDMYTIINHFGSLKGLKIVIVGDILYSRVARSNIIGLTKMGAEVVICGPHTLLPTELLNNHSLLPIITPFNSVRVETNIEHAMADADVVMALRIQLERQSTNHLPSLREYSYRFQINKERLNLAKPNVLVMHPGPMNEGVEISSDVAHGPKSVIEEQVSNGVAIRMAALYWLSSPKRLEA